MSHFIFFSLLIVTFFCAETRADLIPVHEASCHDCKKLKQGPPGATGPRGPIGFAETSNFLSVFTTTNPKNGVAPNTAVVFDQLAIPTQGDSFTYNKKTGIVTFSKKGFYQVTFGMSIAEPPDAALALKFDPAGIYPNGLVPGSELSISSSCTDNPIHLMTTQSVIVHVTEHHQKLTLINADNSNSIQMAAPPTGFITNPVLAYMVIKRWK